MVWCCKALDEVLLRFRGGRIGVDEWLAWAARSLVAHAYAWYVAFRPAHVLLDDASPRTREARRLLVRSLLPHAGEVRVDDTQLRLAQFMAAEGVLRRGHGSNSFAVS